jgi:hypothetical protein
MHRESQNSSACVAHPVSIKRRVVEKVVKVEDILVVETTAGKFPVFLLHIHM